jgi:hypothetical protein
MGPLFSLALLVVGMGFGMSVAYLVARIFLSASVALRAAVLFVIAGAIGGAGAGLVLAFVVGVGGTLTNGWQVVVYLSSLALSGLLSGVLVVRLYLARVRSNKIMEPTR